MEFNNDPMWRTLQTPPPLETQVPDNNVCNHVSVEHNVTNHSTRRTGKPYRPKTDNERIRGAINGAITSLTKARDKVHEIDGYNAHFSGPALRDLSKCITEYTEQMIQRSIAITRLRGIEHVSPREVRQAHRTINQGAERFLKELSRSR